MFEYIALKRAISQNVSYLYRKVLFNPVKLYNQQTTHQQYECQITDVYIYNIDNNIDIGVSDI